MRMLRDAALEYGGKQRNKFHAVKSRDDEGRVFDSLIERRRWFELETMERAGLISNLEFHPHYDLIVDGQRIGRGYTADSRYIRDGRLVVEDVKGVRTRDLRVRLDLMKACHGIEVELWPNRTPRPRGGRP